MQDIFIYAKIIIGVLVVFQLYSLYSYIKYGKSQNQDISRAIRNFAILAFALVVAIISLLANYANVFALVEYILGRDFIKSLRLIFDFVLRDISFVLALDEYVANAVTIIIAIASISVTGLISLNSQKVVYFAGNVNRNYSNSNLQSSCVSKAFSPIYLHYSSLRL